jgi:glyoxylase-like metal-dependent hydrolase (beta-lactamase superfamily II)
MVWLMKTRTLVIALLLATRGLALESDRAGLTPGSLAEPWLTGGPDCVAVPDWQVHAYNEDFYILRQSGCINAEKPFLYLIFGEDKALLQDTGVAAEGTGRVIPTAPVILDLMAKWAAKKRHKPVSLVVIHSHSHGDHTAGDAQFAALPNVQVVAATPADVQKATGMTTWPTSLGQIDLGGRVIDVIPIPGHDAASIALYDRKTGNLMTGDSLYPGRLYVPESQIDTYAASAKRLVDFVTAHPVAHVLGAHIEQARQPYVDYPRGSTYQPKEHVLELARAHVFELHEAFKQMSGRPVRVVYPDFSVIPRAAKTPLSPTIQAGDGLGLQPGAVPTGWKSGGPNCVTVPNWQVQEYNEDFYILRESGCVHAEKPFLFLMFGDRMALLEDTGVARRDPDANGDKVIPTAPVIMELIAKWAARKNRAPVPLVVIHSHAHGDHVAGDAQFQALPNVQVIAPVPAAIQQATGIRNWPADIGAIDLGGRTVDVIPFPGHNEASIALYDRRTGILLTGDSLYPGLLSVNQADLSTFALSAQRLAAFVRANPVSHVFGTHIEQKATPYLDYGRGTVYQPEESPLALSRAHVFELNEMFIRLNGTLTTVAGPEFTIVPRGAATASPPATPR